MDSRQIEFERFKESHVGDSRGTGRSVRLYRSARSLIGRGLFCTVLTALALLLEVAFDQTPRMRLVALIPAAAWLNLLRVYFDNLWVFRSRIICHYAGRFSLRFSMPIIYYSDIREIQVVQGVWARILNYGDVLVSTAATRGIEMTLRGVRNPKAIARYIERMRLLHKTSVMKPFERNAA